MKTEKVEIRPDWGSYDEITIVDPNSRSESPDTIYVGVPYTGQSDPSLIYLIKENINNSGLSFAISLEASSFAKHIFENIAASANK